MATAGVVAIAVLIAVAISAAGYWSYKREQARRAALASFAGQHGFVLTQRDDQVLTRWDERDEPFDDGFDKRARQVMRGSWDGRPALLFDYRYHTWQTSTDSKGHTSRRKQSHDLAITTLQTEQRFPGLSVSPEGMFGRLVGRLANTDIQLEWEDFNRAFTVTCRDRRFASDVLHQQMMELLMRDQELAWMFNGPDIMTVRSGVHDPADLGPTLEQLDAILDMVPEHVKQSDWSTS